MNRPIGSACFQAAYQGLPISGRYGLTIAKKELLTNLNWWNQGACDSYTQQLVEDGQSMKQKLYIGKHGFIIGSESHKNAVKELKEVLSKFHRYAVETKLTYWAVYGTLIGVYRHSDIIPWDEDIDLAVAVNDWDRLSGLWASAGEKHAYRRPNGDTWGKWHYKIVVLCGVPLKMLKYGSMDDRFKFKLESHTTYACDISGVDIFCKPQLAGIDATNTERIIRPHQFGDGVIMAPKHEYGESYLCEKYGRDWWDWRSYLEKHYKCPRKEEFQEITVGNFYEYCFRADHTLVKK